MLNLLANVLIVQIELLILSFSMNANVLRVYVRRTYHELDY